MRAFDRRGPRGHGVLNDKATAARPCARGSGSLDWAGSGAGGTTGNDNDATAAVASRREVGR